MSEAQEHVLGEDGQFHVEDEAVDISVYGFEDWIAFALFWMMAAIVFYQVYTRYVLSDSAGWVFGAMLFGFLLMFLRSLQVAWRHWKNGYSVLERPEFGDEAGLEG